MGGVISRNLILNQIGTENLKGVIFIASPLNGSFIKEEVENDLRRLIPLFNSF
jgi:hypothetical protein